MACTPWHKTGSTKARRGAVEGAGAWIKRQRPAVPTNHPPTLLTVRLRVSCNDIVRCPLQLPWAAERHTANVSALRGCSEGTKVWCRRTLPRALASPSDAEPQFSDIGTVAEVLGGDRGVMRVRCDRGAERCMWAADTPRVHRHHGTAFCVWVGARPVGRAADAVRARVPSHTSSTRALCSSLSRCLD